MLDWLIMLKNIKICKLTNFCFIKTFRKYFVAIHENKQVLKCNKPIYVGFSILDLSKLFMYDFSTTTLKGNMMVNCYLQIQTVQFMKLKHDVY